MESVNILGARKEHCKVRGLSFSNVHVSVLLNIYCRCGRGEGRDWRGGERGVAGEETKVKSRISGGHPGRKPAGKLACTRFSIGIRICR